MNSKYIFYRKDEREHLHSEYGIFLPDYQVISNPVIIEPPVELIAGIDTYISDVTTVGAFSYFLD